MKTTITSSMLTVALAFFAFSQTTRAIDPPPDGGYLNGNTAEGDYALLNLEIDTSYFNTAIGTLALGDLTSASDNTAVGHYALRYLASGHGNTAMGSSALGSQSGDFNTATGFYALGNNGTGSWNTANGVNALLGNTSGGNNAATGYGALESNTTGSFNTATGTSALAGNTTGGFNTADGAVALASNTIGNNNVASGYSALSLNTTGLNNTALGYYTLLRNTTGSSNIAVGYGAGQNLTTGNNNIDIGNAGVAGESRTIRVGFTGRAGQVATYIAGISGATVPVGVPVIIDTGGHLGTTTSSARYKEGIKPMDKASEALFALKPVTFRYKHELDPDRIPQFGLVAEDVAKINRDLVAFDEKGNPYTVRYEAVNAMLLNEFLKEHRKVEEQETTIDELKATTAKQTSMLARQEKAIATLTFQVQKVSARVEAQQAAPRLASE